MPGTRGKVTTAILEELKGRGGFDGWWDSLDPAIQSDIELSLGEVIFDTLELRDDGCCASCDGVKC